MAKGIGIILVVIGHALTMGEYARAFVYSFHMPLFFIISGAVMKPVELHELPPLKRLGKTILLERRLLAYYFFYSLCFIVFDIFVRYHALKQMDARDLVWDCYQTVTFHGINVLWFLITLALAKIFTRIIDAGLHSMLWKAVIAVALFLAGAVAGDAVSPRLEPVGVFQLVYYPVSSVIETMTMTSFTLLGYLVRNQLPDFVARFRFVLPFLMIPNILLCQLFGTVDFHLLQSGFPPLTLLLSFTGTLSVIGIGELLGHWTPTRLFFGWFSKNSLFIMVTHEYFMITAFVVVPILGLFTIPASTYKIFQVALLLACEVPLCLWIKPLAEKPVAGMVSLVRATPPKHERR